MNLTQDLDIWTLIVNASIVVKVVMALLAAVSFIDRKSTRLNSSH